MKNKRRGVVVFASIVILTAVLFSAIFGIGYSIIKRRIDFSVDEALFEGKRGSNVTTFYYDASGGEGEYLPSELFVLSPAESKRVWYPYESIGDNVKLAVLAAEDRDFYKHRGINLKRTLYAAFNYIFRTKGQFGASTITQQVIKNISGDSERTVFRKISEIARALHVEKHYSKEEILELYLNIVPMGEGIAGVGLASEYYFGKSSTELTVAEAATLVGILNAPTRYNPHTHPQKCTGKRNNVLYAMFDAGVIGEEEYQSAISEPLSVISVGDKGREIRSWFIETVYDEVEEDLASKLGISRAAAGLMISSGGLKIYTTENPIIQERLEAFFQNESLLPREIGNGLQYAMTVVDSRNGNLLGVIGAAGEKQANRVFNYATAPVPPASALKPLALYAPLINSGKINWSTVFDDVPVTVSENSDGGYTVYPQNYPSVYDGLITVSDAVRVSKNTVAVRLYNLLDKEKIFKSLKEDFGFSTLIRELKLENGRTVTDLAPSPLALGQLTRGISLRKLTEAYTVFPSQGIYSGGRSYIKVIDSRGNVLLEKAADGKRVFRKECANIMNQLLSLVTDSGTAKSVTLDEILDTAGKTGTSARDMDRLFVGYTPYYTAGIWCGYADGKTSLNVERSTHLKIWDEIMKQIHELTLGAREEYDGFSTEGLVYLPYCKDSGELLGEACELDLRGERLEYGYFETTNRPSHKCQCHVICYLDELTGNLATRVTEYENARKIALIDVADRNFPAEVNISDSDYVIERWISNAENGSPSFIWGDFNNEKRRRRAG